VKVVKPDHLSIVVQYKIIFQFRITEDDGARTSSEVSQSQKWICG